MAMKKVDLGGNRKKFKAIELERYGVVIREPLYEKAVKEFNRFEEICATGITKRMDITHGHRMEESAEILEWLWSHGLSMAQQLVAHGCSNIQLDGNPIIFHKFNVMQGNEWNINPGVTVNDPKVNQYMDVLPKEIICPDNFMQWSGDMQYPYCFAHFTHGELCLKGIEICNERGWFYPLPANNVMWSGRKNNFRLGGWIGAMGTLAPGHQCVHKHRYVHEKGLYCNYVYTPKEEQYLQDHGFETVQVSAAEHIGMDLDQWYDDLIAGKLDDELLKPGVKVDFTAAIPYQRVIRRGLWFWRTTKMLGEREWYKETNRCDENGVMIGFGEFEEEEFRERIKAQGYIEVDEESLFKGKVLEGLHRDCYVPESLLA